MPLFHKIKLLYKVHSPFIQNGEIMVKTCKITDEIIKICADNIRLGLSYSACSKAIHVTYQTWRNWEKLGAEGKAPYSKWYIAIQAAEADLLRECLESVKLSMKLGDVKSAYFLLQTRFSGEGYGKQSQVSMTSENLNVNVNPQLQLSEQDKIRADILSRLAPRNDRKLIESSQGAIDE